MRRRLSLVVLCWAVACGAARADQLQLELWPEVDTWWRVSPNWRLSLLVPISKNIETAYREGNIILQADYAFGTARWLDRRLLDENRALRMKLLLLRGGYLGGKSLGDDGEAYKERTLFTELHVRNPVKGGFLLQHRLRSDVRWLGEDAEQSYRLRYRLQVEKEYQAGRASIVPYLNAEPYYDSRYRTVNRIRVIPGASVSWSPRFAIEGNVTYQYDSRSSATQILALNTILHVYFETGRARTPPPPRREPDDTGIP